MECETGRREADLLGKQMMSPFIFVPPVLWIVGI